jgi:hypothetical protein
MKELLVIDSIANLPYNPSKQGLYLTFILRLYWLLLVLPLAFSLLPNKCLLLPINYYGP